MLAHPEQLNLEDTGLYGCMSASLERIRTVKERFDLRNRDKMGLGVLFERLHLQLKADVIRFRSSETGTGEAGRERLAKPFICGWS